MNFTGDGLQAIGKCEITGTTTDDPGGWTLGMIQLQWIMTDWAYYRGQSNSNGDSFLQFGRPPARPTQACRDTIKSGAIFVDLDPNNKTIAETGDPFPIKMEARLRDKPRVEYDLTRINSLTRSVNFLSEAQVELHFCTVLSLRNPEPRRGPVAGTYTHLRHFLWNMRWQARFLPSDFADLTKPWTITPIMNEANVSRVIHDGGPTDQKFSRIITSGLTPNCFTLASDARNLVKPRESATWTTYDVHQ